jgi:hypothetical protein
LEATPGIEPGCTDLQSSYNERLRLILRSVAKKSLWKYLNGTAKLIGACLPITSHYSGRERFSGLRAPQLARKITPV